MVGTFSEAFAIACAELETEVERQSCHTGGEYLLEISASPGMMLYTDKAEAMKERERERDRRRETEILKLKGG